MGKLLRWTIKDLLYCFEEMQKEQFDAIVIIDGNRGCLTGDTIVQTMTGLKKIDDIKKYEILKAYDFKENKVINAVSKKINSGKKMVYQIKTEDGRTINATQDHIFFIQKENKILELPLKKLKEGDELICIS